MANFEKPIVKPVLPNPDVVSQEAYIFTGEKNYEAPKPDPWVEEKK
jgi:hypothetical protein